MRVAFATANYWPYVRRGAERVVAEYAQYLVGRGHSVDIITTKPGASRVVRDGNLAIHYDRQINHPLLARGDSGFRFYAFSLTLMRRLFRRSYDVVHLWLYANGLPVRIFRELRGTPYLYQIVSHHFVRRHPLDQWLFDQVALPADRIAALTPRAAARLAGELRVPVEVLPPSVDMDTFFPCAERDIERPRVLFASDLRDYAKGLPLLLRAWDEIHRRCPSAVLVLCGPAGQVGIAPHGGQWTLPDLVREPDARSAIELRGEGRAADLPGQYSMASVTVLPSLGEAFGLVLAESLACGTPVVGSDSGGPGEIISDTRIGATVPVRDGADLSNDRVAAELADRVVDAIELAHDPDTRARCRNHAQQWSREQVGPRLIRLYDNMIADRPRATAAGAA